MQTHLERFIRFLAAEKGLSTAYQLSVRQTLEEFARFLEMDHKADIRFIKPHAECHRGYQSFDLVVHKQADDLLLGFRLILLHT